MDKFNITPTYGIIKVDKQDGTQVHSLGNINIYIDVNFIWTTYNKSHKVDPRFKERLTNDILDLLNKYTKEDNGL